MRGTEGVVAAIRGARRVRGPLSFAVLTSIVAFVPLLYIPGGIGEVWRALPVIVITMLVISLIESLFILPRHLSHLPGPDWTPTGVVDRFFAGTQARANRTLYRLIDGPLDHVLHFATRQPAIILASAIGILVISVSLLPAGLVPARFIDVVEGDYVNATLEMPDGATASHTLEVATEIEAAGRSVIERLSRDNPDAGASPGRGHHHRRPDAPSRRRRPQPRAQFDSPRQHRCGRVQTCFSPGAQHLCHRHHGGLARRSWLFAVRSRYRLQR